MTKSYWVIGADGQAYGPADDATLAQWAREGRLTAQSALQDAATNQRIYAGQVPTLASALGGGTGGVAGQPGHQQPQGYHQPAASYQQSAGYQQQQTAVPIPFGFQQPAAYQPQGGYQQPIGYANPYANAQVAGHGLTTFSTVGAVLLHWVTFGLFSIIYHGLKHEKLPMVRPDDPSGGKAVGFMFIPFFNIWYWNFFSNLRLCDRLNEQRRLAGLPETAPRGLALAFAICMAIPYVNFLIGFPFIAPIYFGVLQANVNELVRATRGPNA